MKIEIDVEFPNTEELLDKFGLDVNGRTQRVIDNSFIHYMRLNMPKDSGMMIANTRNPESGLVTVETPYAHYINEGILYVNPEHNSPGFPVYQDGVIVDFVGYKGNRVASDRTLKNYYDANGGPGRGSHFVERTINIYKEEIIREAQKEMSKL